DGRRAVVRERAGGAVDRDWRARARRAAGAGGGRGGAGVFRDAVCAWLPGARLPPPRRSLRRLIATCVAPTTTRAHLGEECRSDANRNPTPNAVARSIRGECRSDASRDFTADRSPVRH